MDGAFVPHPNRASPVPTIHYQLRDFFLSLFLTLVPHKYIHGHYLKVTSLFKGNGTQQQEDIMQ